MTLALKVVCKILFAWPCRLNRLTGGLRNDGRWRIQLGMYVYLPKLQGVTYQKSVMFLTFISLRVLYHTPIRHCFTRHWHPFSSRRSVTGPSHAEAGLTKDTSKNTQYGVTCLSKEERPLGQQKLHPPMAKNISRFIAVQFTSSVKQWPALWQALRQLSLAPVLRQ